MLQKEQLPFTGMIEIHNYMYVKALVMTMLL